MSKVDGYSIGQITIIELIGADRNKIVNNLCTQDLRQLQSGESKETFVLDPKGRTLAHGIACCSDKQTWFLTVPDQAAKLVPHFDRYIIREDAVVRDASSEWKAILLPPESPWLATSNAAWTIGSNCQSHPDGIAFAIHAPWISRTSKLLLIQQEHFSSLTSSMESLIESDCEDRTGWEQSRIENFWPWFGVDFDDKNLPQELDIDARAMSFKKGCYLGQETVARLDALGQVQKRLGLVEIQGHQQSTDTSVPVVPVVGQTLHAEEKPIGTITSLVQLPLVRQQWIAFAMLKRSAFQTEASLTTDEGLTMTIRRTI